MAGTVAMDSGGVGADPALHAGETGDSAGRSTRAAGRCRLVVYTAAWSYSVRKGIVDIDEAMPGLEWLVMLQQPARRPLGRLLASQRQNLRRNGWRWIPYTATELLRRLAARGGHPPEPPGTVPGAEYASAAVAVRPNLRLVRTPDLHGDLALAEVRAFAPELGLSIAAPILRAPLYTLPRLGTLNLHKGRLPDFRGMPPAFWELWHGAGRVGCTVHEVDAKLDTGRIVAEAGLDRARFSTVRGLQLGLDEVGSELMRRAVEEVLGGRAVPRPQPVEGGRTFRKPTLEQVASLDRRLAAERVRLAPSAGRPVRRVASEAVWHGWNLGAHRLAAPRITVLLYHRVSDEVRDNLTVGIEQFDRQMALLRHHCEVLAIDEVLAAERVPRAGRPLVAVTFDDGYLDNHRHAAPILRRHGIPAAFFVSTGMIGTNGRFPHDLRRGNPPIATMGWGELREMRDWGFTIGSHTVNHIDCARVEPAVVHEELARSRDDLKRELAIDRPIFAYPYGGREHMTDERRIWVREAGYAGCLAAYGGSNVGTVDRWNVLRRGIHWEYDDAALRVACLGLTR